MALLFIEGFEGVSSSTGTSSVADTQKYLETKYLTPVWQGTNQPAVYSGWQGGKAMTMGTDAFGDGNWIAHQIATGVTTFVIGFAIKPEPYRGQANAFLWHLSSNADNVIHMTVILQEQTHLEFRRSTGTVLCSAQNALTPGIWNYVEMKITINNTTGSVEVHVNGDTVLNVTSLDTNNGGSSGTVDFFQLDGVEGTSTTEGDQTLFDDLYILDTSGTANNDFLGPIKVEELLPDGAGDSTGWTPSAGSNYQNVDEAVSDDDTTYNSASSSSTKDLFTASDLTLIDGTVFGVQTDVYARVTEPQILSILSKIKVSTTEDDGATNSLVYDTGYAVLSDIFEEDPNAMSAWTPTTVNSMQIGYEVG